MLYSCELCVGYGLVTASAYGVYEACLLVPLTILRIGLEKTRALLTPTATIRARLLGIAIATGPPLSAALVYANLLLVLEYIGDASMPMLRLMSMLLIVTLIAVRGMLSIRRSVLIREYFMSSGVVSSYIYCSTIRSLWSLVGFPCVRLFLLGWYWRLLIR